MKDNNEIYEIDLIELLGILLHRWWILFITAIVGGAIALGGTITMVTPLYRTSIMLYVNNSSISLGSAKLNLSQGDLAASQSLVDTYGVILTSSLTLQDLEESLNMNPDLHHRYSYKQLRGMVSSGSANGTEIMRITVTCADYDDGVIIANTIAEVLPKRILKIVEGSSVTVVDLAEYPTSQSSPNYTKNCMVGLAAGFIVACAGVLVYDMFIHDTIESPEYLTQSFGKKIPVLSTIPAINNSSDRGYRYKYRYRYGYGYGKKYRRNYYRYDYQSRKMRKEDEKVKEGKEAKQDE